MDESKLVAKAHLLAAFGQSPDERMESNLRDLYARIEQGEKEPLRFLRDALPQAPAISREAAIERVEVIYRRLMQAHIDNGRKTYAIGAYYCAVLGEIALHEGRLAAFKQWHEKYMEAYKRFHALPRRDGYESGTGIAQSIVGETLNGIGRSKSKFINPLKPIELAFSYLLA